MREVEKVEKATREWVCEQYCMRCTDVDFWPDGPDLLCSVDKECFKRCMEDDKEFHKALAYVNKIAERG